MDMVRWFRSSVLRKVMILSVLGTLLVLAACGGGAKHMTLMETKPRIAVKKDKAVLVIARTTSFGGGVAIDNFLDGKMIGQTRGKSFFVTDVTPGSHYVMAHAENWAAARINFAAGRVYFLNQMITVGVWMARTGFSPMTPKDGLEQINESGCDYLVYNKPGEDMSAEDYKGVKDDFEKEVKEDPGRHKDTLEYKGYSTL